MDNDTVNDDITVIIQGQQFKTTRKILTDNSEYFENLFKECKDITNEITLDDRVPHIFEDILRYFKNIEYDIVRSYDASSKHHDKFLQEMKFYLIKYDRLDKYGELSKIKVEELIKEINEKKKYIRELEQKIRDIEKECENNRSKIEDINKIIRRNLYLKLKENKYVYYITRTNSSYVRMSFANMSDAEKYLEMKNDPDLQIIISKSENMTSDHIVNPYF